MKTVLSLLLILFAFNLPAGAQCNAAFSYTINKDQLTIIPAAANSSNVIDYLSIYNGNNFVTGDSYANSGHIFKLDPGTYLLKRVINDPVSGCADSMQQTITINYVPTCSAAISYTTDSFSFQLLDFASNAVYTGTGIKSDSWTIDGIQDAPATEVLSVGDHQVCYNMTTNSGCIASDCKTITVQIPKACNFQPSFTATASTDDDHVMNFVASPNQSNLTYHWGYGNNDNGILSQAYSPVSSYSYSYPGTYEVRLRIDDNANQCYEIDSAAINVVIPSLSCTTAFTYTLNGGQATFTGTSNQPIVSQAWTITTGEYDFSDPITLYTSNPVYNFTDTGYYSVSLSQATSTGCSGTDYGMIHVDHLGQEQDISSINSYPNPVAGDEVHLDLVLANDVSMSYTITNINGTVVYQSQLQGYTGDNVITVPLWGLITGQYFVDITYGNQHAHSSFERL
jgi:Secretion system C-terminal sorting domain